jgi:catecholate siderophore receptor
VNKQGFAPTYRWNIGERNEYSLGFYHLQTDGRPLYNHPWVIDNGMIVPTLDARNYYGLSSDYLRTQTDHASFSLKHRVDANSTLKTTLRQGRYSRDLWASSIGFCNSNGANNASGWAQAAACPGQGALSSLSQVNDNTVLTRTGKGRRGLSNVTQAQVEYDNQFNAWGHKHELLAGVDLVREGADRNNNVGGSPLYTATSSNSVNLDPAYTTRVGTPNDGESRVDTRSIAMNTFNTRTFGLYAQDMLHLNEQFKLVGGLRFDRFLGVYRDTSSNRLNLGESLWSPRLGTIWQPDDASSYYLSYGTSYNTSGDTYQYGTVNLGLSGANATLANTPPEKSRNLEVGGKWDVFDKKALLGVALFRSEKYNERNTDVDTVANQYFAGRLSPVWEMFYNHTWIPFARIDSSSQVLSSNGTGAQVEGDRPALTPKHSASLWTTYRVAPLWRVGTGLNYRGEQNPDQQRAYTAAAFTTADAMLEHTLSDNTVVKLNLTNLTNKRYADQLYRSFYVPGASRRLELSVKALF